jgi:hypothetical protein
MLTERAQIEELLVKAKTAARKSKKGKVARA